MEGFTFGPSAPKVNERRHPAAARLRRSGGLTAAGERGSMATRRRRR